MRIGYFLSSEEWGPKRPGGASREAEEAGFDGLWISDHYHPWNDEQGHSPFVWATIGAIAQATSKMKVTTAVTCPTFGYIRRSSPRLRPRPRYCSTVASPRVGTGEALNEHILGDRWPAATSAWRCSRRRSR